MIKRLVLALALALALGSCGYFNTLYNARRQFADAERARLRGDVATARTGYNGSIDKAAKSYRRYPQGRWADDALYLIARARFRLGENLAARAAFDELLARATGEGMRTAAHAYAGAAGVNLADAAHARMHLDSALAHIDRAPALAGFAHLWRARARAELGDVAGAWHDLDAVTSSDDREFQAVQVERVAIAVQSADTTRAADAFARLLSGRDVRRELDTVNSLAVAAMVPFGAERVRAMLSPVHGDFVPAARDSLALIRARLADRAGDTLTANRELLELAGRSAAATAAAARVLVARSRLRGASSLEQLSSVRTLLLPAIANVDAQALIRTIRLVDVLVRRAAETGQPLALFAAAEVARDELDAPLLARQLFTTFVDVGAQTPWAGKALLAAIALDPNAPESNALRARIAALPPNPYTTLLRGEGAEAAFESAEERLDRSLAGLRAEAAQLAQQRESGVTRMVFVLDSIRLSAQADTVRARCGIMVDTLALAGIRADSVRSACLRGDTVLVAARLKADTLQWKRRAIQDDTMRIGPRRAPTTRDTIR